MTDPNITDLDLLDVEKNAEAAWQEKLLDLMTPGLPIELDPDEAERLGAFVEDAMTESDAWESASDETEACDDER